MNTTNSERSCPVAGIGVFKERLDVCPMPEGETFALTNDQEGIDELLERLKQILTHKGLCALMGVAPFNRDSGTLRGKRKVWSGRAQVRAALYMGALVATRCNPVIE